MFNFWSSIFGWSCAWRKPEISKNLTGKILKVLNRKIVTDKSQHHKEGCQERRRNFCKTLNTSRAVCQIGSFCWNQILRIRWIVAVEIFTPGARWRIELYGFLATFSRPATMAPGPSSAHLAADCDIESSICEHVLYEPDRLLARKHLAEFVEDFMSPHCLVCCTQRSMGTGTVFSHFLNRASTWVVNDMTWSTLLSLVRKTIWWAEII